MDTNKDGHLTFKQMNNLQQCKGKKQNSQLKNLWEQISEGQPEIKKNKFKNHFSVDMCIIQSLVNQYYGHCFQQVVIITKLQQMKKMQPNHLKKRWFNYFDLNDDGKIQNSQFITINQFRKENTGNQIFDYLDSNNDDILTEKEIQLMNKQSQKQKTSKKVGQKK